MATDMDVDVDFKTQFYNLEGVHCKERKKNFNKLLKSVSPNVLEQQLDIEPRNYLEKIFYVDILIHAKRVDKLVEILKEGNGVLTSRILKQKWFFKDFFEKMTESSIVNEFLPTLSFSIRMKVLKKLSLALPEQRMDQIFNCLFERYGLFIAQQFLFSCSVTKIKDVLINNNVTLSVEQLKRILDKDSNLVKIYMDEYKKNRGRDFNDWDFLSYLTWKYPNLYFEFASGFQKLGRRTTKAVLKINKAEVLKDVEAIEEKFNLSTVVKEVKNFHEDYLYKLFPSDMNRISYYSNQRCINTYLGKYPIKKRWNILSNVFKKVYNDDIINHLELFEQKMAIMFPAEIKLKWAEIKLKETNDVMYIKYFEPKKAFELIKERINVTSDITKRNNLLKIMIAICRDNKDYNTYEAVLKYICVRHRNEDTSSRNLLFLEIARDIDYDLATITFWKYVNELIDLMRAKGELPQFQITCQYLTFLIKKKMPSDEAFAQYLKDIISQKCGVAWRFLLQWHKEPSIKAEMMKRFMTYCLQIIDKEPNKKKLSAELMKTIVEFNLKHKDVSIDLKESPVIVGYIMEIVAKTQQVSDDDDMIIFEHLIINDYSKGSPKPLRLCEDDRLMDTLRNVVAKQSNGSSTLASALFKALEKPRTTTFQESLLEYYFTKFLPDHCPSSKQVEAMKYFITQEPGVVAKYISHILPLEVRIPILDYSIVKLYSHLSIDAKLIAYIEPLVSTTSTCDSKIRLIGCLSKIMSTDDFIKLIRGYVPVKAKLDLNDLEQKDLYEAQCACVKALRNLSETVKLIPLLESFCQGDYLQSSLPFLYKVLYRINEEQVVSVINVLAERAVSVRKHAVYLSLEVLPQKTALDLFNAISAKEKNLSAKKYLFQGVLNYFLKNPSEYLLGMVIASMSFIDKNDKELLESLTKSVVKVPEKLKPTFVEHLWGYLDIMEKQEVNVLVYRLSLLCTIKTYNITFFSSLKENFCQAIIKDYFFSNNYSLIDNMYHFVANYLLAHNDEKHFEYVFDIIKSYKAVHWESNDKEKLKYIFTFFDEIYRVYAATNDRFLTLFKSFWQHLFNHEECFGENVLLRLMVLYKDSRDIVKFAEAVDKTFEELVLEYGPYIADVLLECIQRFFSNVYFFDDKTFLMIKKPLTKAQFALQLLKSNQSDVNCYIASRLVADCVGDDQKETRSQVIDMLKSIDDFVVRIRCNNLLKK